MSDTSEIWLDQFASRLGFRRLSEWLPNHYPPSILYAFVTILLYHVVSRVYAFTHGLPLYNTENPYFLLQPFALLGAVYGSRSLKQSYDSAMREMRVQKRATSPQMLMNLVPSQLPWVLFVVGAVLQLIRAFMALPGYGVLDIIANFVVFPFVYFPIIAQFGAVYIGTQVLAPWRLVKSNIGLHYYDPHGVGGLRPLGELLKKAYYYIVAGLVIYTLITYAPFISTDWSVVPFAGALFTTVWLLSVGTVGFGVHQLHRFMRREKREKTLQLEQKIEDLVDNPWDIEHSVPEETRGEVEDLRQRMDRVSAVREYPATFSIWSQLLLGIAIPKGVQLLISTA